MGEASLKKTPLYDEHSALGARIVPFAGTQMPVQYTGVVDEHRAVRAAAGLFDVCHMGELLLLGPGALAAVDRIVTQDIAATPNGHAVYTVACNPAGTILDDLIVYRHGPEEILVVCNASNLAKMSAHFERETRGRCAFRDESESTALLALQGPRAIEILARAGAAASVATLPRFGVNRGLVGPVRVTVARTGYTGEDGVEIFCERSDAVSLWRLLLESGRPMGLKPCGLGARDTLRLEAKLCLYGNDIDETTDPLEAGLGWVVKLEKPDFIGRAALLARKAAGQARKLVGFQMVGRGIARHGYPVVDAEGRSLGTVTSGSPAPTLGTHIGLAYVSASRASVGSRFGIEIRGKAVEAEVVKTPFYRKTG